MESARFEQKVGRYMLFGQIGAGGMAAVHLGRLRGPLGFSRLVAIKRLHPHLLQQRSFVDAFVDEARIAARVSHPNVVSTHDVVVDGDEVLLVMDYVHGLALSVLTRTNDDVAAPRKVPPGIAAAIAVDMLHGLHAAHEARDERGRPLGLVHRDVSPQNVIVGADGVARLLDFGIAKSLRRLHTTMDGSVKGKLAYMAPERLLVEGGGTSSVDVFGAGVVIWEMLAGERYFGAASENETLMPRVAACVYRKLEDPALADLDVVLERALRRDPNERYATASDLAVAIENAIDKIASRMEIIAWVDAMGCEQLKTLATMVEEIERGSLPPPTPRTDSAAAAAQKNNTPALPATPSMPMGETTPARATPSKVRVVVSAGGSDDNNASFEETSTGVGAAGAADGTTEAAPGSTNEPVVSRPSPESVAERGPRKSLLVVLVACAVLMVVGVAAIARSRTQIANTYPTTSPMSATDPPASTTTNEAPLVTATPSAAAAATVIATTATARARSTLSKPLRVTSDAATPNPKPPDPEAPSDRK